MAYDEALAERMRELLDGEDQVTEKRMFGGLAFLLSGNMALAVSGQGGLLLRVDPAEAAELLAEPNTNAFVMPGRQMKGWLRVEPAGLASDGDLRRWVSIGVARARSFPPK